MAVLVCALLALPALAQQEADSSVPQELQAVQQALELAQVRPQERLEYIPDSARLRAHASGQQPPGAANFRLTDGISTVSLYKDQEFTDSVTGQRFRVMTRVQRENNTLAVLVTPTRGGETAEIQRGTWVLYRNRENGQPETIRIYFSTDPELFINIRADNASPNSRSQIDMLVYGAYVRKDVPLGIAFLDLFNTPLSTIIARTRQQIPWSYFETEAIRYRDIQATAAVIRAALPTLVFYEDGAFDADGKPVLIETGERQTRESFLAAAKPDQDQEKIVGGVNCSGFAKWVIDGILRPRVGSGSIIERLKGSTAAPDTHFTRNYREERDLFFGLDWTRNLAAAVVSMKARQTILPDNAGIDVTFTPFSLFTKNPRWASDALGFSGYQRNVGYQAAFLKPLLYALAVTEPGNLYLAAVSSEGGDPNLRAFDHIAVFLPWFDGAGTFHADVFESAEETSLERFLTLHPGVFVHLVRVQVPEQGFFRP